MAYIMRETPAHLIHTWLSRQLSGGALCWLDDQLERIRHSADLRTLSIAIGLTPRKLGKADLNLTAEDQIWADRSRTGWDPRGWSVAEAGRVFILIAASQTERLFAARFGELCRAAEVGELVAFYKGLPLYRGQEELVDQAREGLRTNMRAVFEAVAHNSPFARERLGKDPWNQMVLKALFVESALHPIQGLDERANPELASIMCDYAHERWSAGRCVSPELWRCVGPHADEKMLSDINKILQDGSDIERRAAALALASNRRPDAARLLARDRELTDLIERGQLSWGGIYLELQSIAFGA